MEIGKNKIRNLFYFATVVIVIILSTLLTGSFINLYQNQSMAKINQLSRGIIDMKKIYVKDVVERTIQDIKIERQYIYNQENENLKKWHKVIQEMTIEAFLSYVDNQTFDTWNVDFLSIKMSVYDRENQQILYQSSQNTDEDNDFQNIKEDLFLKNYYTAGITDLITKDNYYITLEVDQESVENMVKDKIMNQVRNEVLVDNGYIWINQVVNYEGGDQYAIRLVHPNLPETEGDYLSTNDTDAHGNFPYLSELKGIKEEGELFQEYYFKKKDSDEVAHKLSFEKLYEPYDWVIATGVYLDDVDQLIAKETSEMEATKGSFVFSTIIIVLLCLMLSLTLIYYFERLISGLVRRFENEVNDKNIELQNEKAKIEQIAFKDSLTGLLTRRAMQKELEKSHKDAMLYNRKYAIGIGDIDFFKDINDEYGHHAGDYVLCELANLFNNQLPNFISIARWGGEEFLFLLDSTNADNAFEVMNSLRVTVENYNFLYDNNVINVTISIGVTEFDMSFASYDTVLKDADRKLYKAKDTGRNKVVG